MVDGALIIGEYGNISASGDVTATELVATRFATLTTGGSLNVTASTSTAPIVLDPDAALMVNQHSGDTDNSRHIATGQTIPAPPA